MRVGICMLQASRSLGRPLLIAALLLPAVARARGQLDLSPPTTAGKAPSIAISANHPTESPMAPAAPSVKSAAGADLAHKAHGKTKLVRYGKVKSARILYAHVLHLRGLRPHRAQKRYERSADAKEGDRRTASIRPNVPSGAIVVSTRGLNRFVFPAAIVKGPIFPADAPVLGAPVYLDSNRQVLIQFAPGSDKPFEMVVELAGHQVKSYLLAPRNVSGITYRASGAHPPRKTWGPDRDPREGGTHSAAITLLRSAVMGEVPDAFYPTRLPPMARFDKFDIVPRASWSDGSGHRILVYALVSEHGQAAVVAPPEFYHKGMTAILLTGDVVDATNSPLLYILEGVSRG